MSGLLAFLAGRIVFNVVTVELSEEQERSFPAFGTGTTGCGLFLPLV